jgi:glycosyltransferase involved in cell wall biosynthesis
MRILHVNERASDLGGVERILHDTAKTLAEEGWSQALLHEEDESNARFAEPFEHAGSDASIVERFDPDLVLVHKTRNALRAEQLARRYPTARMVHDHDLFCLRRHKYLPMNGRLCERAAGMACYTNLCFVQRSGEGSTFPITFRGIRAQQRETATNVRMRRYIVGSRWMRDQLVKNGLPEASIDIVHPIPRSLGRAACLPPSLTDEILYVGQIVRGKGVDLLLRALAELRRPWRATLVGDGNHLEACRELAGELGISDRVRFTGWVDHDRLASFYAGARFAVVPSRWPEPFGMVGPEAMARGRPVIGFAAGGIPDWLDDGVTGLLVPPGDIGGLTRAMDRLLGDPALTAAMGRAAAARVDRELTHRSYIDALKRSLEATT